MQVAGAAVSRWQVRRGVDSNSTGTWRLAALLASAGAAEPVAAVALGVDTGQDELAATRRLAALGKAKLLAALEDSDVLIALVDRVWPMIEELAAPEQAATVDELHDKFMLDGNAFTLQLGTIDQFYGGLEGIVGIPNPHFDQGMEYDHCGKDDSARPFEMPNHKAQTTSTVEWRFVHDPEKGADGEGLGFEPYPSPENAREPLPFSHFEPDLKSRNVDLAKIGQPPVSRAEFCGARLYTGPVSPCLICRTSPMM